MASDLTKANRMPSVKISKILECVEPFCQTEKVYRQQLRNYLFVLAYKLFSNIAWQYSIISFIIIVDKGTIFTLQILITHLLIIKNRFMETIAKIKNPLYRYSTFGDSYNEDEIFIDQYDKPFKEYKHERNLSEDEEDYVEENEEFFEY